MCVASYGVIPQAYSVARCPPAATASSPVAVSRSLTSTPLPGRSGTSAARHASIVARLQVTCPTISGAQRYHEYFDREYVIATRPLGMVTALRGPRPACISKDVGYFGPR